MRKLLILVIVAFFVYNNADAQRKAGGIYHQAKYEIMHVVKKGETLSQIAEFYATTTNTLKNYNDISNSSKIKPNQVILVPSTFTIDYIKDELNIPESRFRLVLKDEEEGLFFDPASEQNSEVITTSPNKDVGYVPGNVIKPKSKPKYKAAKTKEEYEAEQKTGHTNTRTTTKTTTVPNTINEVKTTTVVETAIQEGNNKYHLVKTGETLYSLSKAYNVTIEQLKAWNKIPANNQLPLGENIIVGVLAKTNSSATYTAPANNKPVNPKDVQFHVVKQGETLYAIAKKYNLQIESLRQFNNLKNNEISVGQQIMIPALPSGNESGFIRKNEPDNVVETAFVSTDNDVIVELYNAPVTAIPEPVNYQPTNSQAIYHAVAAEETLYRISKQYGTSVEEIRKMNNFSDDFTSIEPGSDIIIGYAALKQDSPMATTTTKNPQWVTVNKDVSIGSPSTQMVKFKRAFEIKNKRKDIYTLEFETGIGTWDRMDDEQNNNLFCLHKTAPIKSVIKVTNPMNNATIFVKVIGKLEPKIGEEDVDIKLTTNAIQRLRILDDRFRLKMKYHVQR